MCAPVLRRAAEDRVLDQPRHLLQVDVGVGNDHVEAGIGRHVDVERAHVLQRRDEVQDRSWVRSSRPPPRWSTSYRTDAGRLPSRRRSAGEPDLGAAVARLASSGTAGGRCRRRSAARPRACSWPPPCALSGRMREAGRTPRALANARDCLAPRTTRRTSLTAGLTKRPLLGRREIVADPRWISPMAAPTAARSARGDPRQQLHQDQTAQADPRAPASKAADGANALLLTGPVQAFRRRVEDRAGARQASGKVESRRDRRWLVVLPRGRRRG